ncbi:MAG: aspartyl protease family protein [Candidatus Omnitrophica bacterium]|nr:aspartyl protease family protein [Candidatus Omnitrophota bacterium]
MGKVVIPITVFAADRSRRGEALEALVDTGATLSMIPGDVLRRLGVHPTDQMPVRLADGRVVRRAVGEARLRVDGHMVTSRVMFGKRRDATVLGLVVLESLGLTVDPTQGRIVKGELLLLTMDAQRSREVRTNA